MKRLCATALCATVVAGMLATSSAPGSTQEWPVRPVRIVNTFAAGGTADVLARLVADHLSTAFKQQFFVETRAGAGGVIGVQSVAASPPDGYNFVITTFSLLCIAPLINPRIGYEPLKGLTNIAYLAGSPTILVVNRTSGINSLSDFIRRAKASARPLSYGTSGLGSSGHVVVETFAKKAGIPVDHVPYKGAAQSLMDVIGGHIDFASPTVSSAAGQLRGNLLTPLAHTAKARLAEYATVPTLQESGYPELIATTWFALSGPANLPADIVAKVNREITTLMAKRELQARLQDDGMLTEPMTADEFAAFIGAEIVRWTPAIRQSGLIGK
ncbi:MAG: tripartite tricarboxylate transporter substrate binding protein [Hyphomicrobiales bacterium]|nr:tripartite tricarboxylate transporter substrate binding protein [Hyphomicrobiales bacterium]